MSLQFMSFKPIKRNGSHIGFCSFKWNNEFQFTEVPVHQILGKKVLDYVL